MPGSCNQCQASAENHPSFKSQLCLHYPHPFLPPWAEALFTLSHRQRSCQEVFTQSWMFYVAQSCWTLTDFTETREFEGLELLRALLYSLLRNSAATLVPATSCSLILKAIVPFCRVAELWEVSVCAEPHVSFETQRQRHTERIAEVFFVAFSTPVLVSTISHLPSPHFFHSAASQPPPPPFIFSHSSSLLHSYTHVTSWTFVFLPLLLICPLSSAPIILQGSDGDSLLPGTHPWCELEWSIW